MAKVYLSTHLCPLRFLSSVTHSLQSINLFPLWLDLFLGIETETVREFILGGAPKSLQVVTAAMKLKDVYSLKEKL